MGTVTVLPATATHTGGTLTGGTDIAVISDGSDATGFATGASGSISALTFASPTIPAGAQIRSVKVGIRGNALAAAVPPIATFTSGGVALQLPIPTQAGASVYDIPLGTFTQDNSAATWTAAKVAASSLAIAGQGGGGAAVEQVYIVVSYNEAPTLSAVNFIFNDFGDPPPVGDSMKMVWTYSDPDGDAQAAYQVKVFTDAVHAAGGFSPDTSAALYDSGTVYNSNARLHRAVDVRAIPAGTYWGYVRASDVGSGLRWSAWSSFSRASVSATVPVVTATAVDSGGYVLLTITTGDTGFYFTAQRSTDGGVTWTTVPRLWKVAGGVLVPSQTLDVSGTTLARDYEAPRGVTVQYRVHEWPMSDWTAVASVAMPASVAWLKDPIAPSLNAQVYTVAPGVQAVRREPQTVYDPIGATKPVVLYDTIIGDTLTGVFRFLTAAGRASWIALHRNQRTLLLQLTDGRQWFAHFGPAVTTSHLPGSAAGSTGAGAGFDVAWTATEVASP